MAVITLLFGPSLAEAQAPEGELSRLYFSGAERLYQQNNAEGAKELLTVALEFSPSNADALYLRGRIARETQAETERALSAFRESLAAGGFERYSPFVARVALIEVLLRTGRTEDAAAELESLPRTDRQGSVAQHELLRARLAALRGNPAEARDRALRMLERYPEDARFLELILRIRDTMGLHETRLLRRHRDEAVGGPYAAQYRAAMVWFMRKATDGRTVREWADRYFELGGSDPLVSVLLVENGVAPANEVDRFLAHGGAEEQWLVRRMVTAADASGTSVPEALSRRLDGYTGFLEDDRDRNGYYEARYRFSDGVLRTVRTDDNEDGRAEREVHFGENGEVRRAVVASGQTVRFAEYPAVRAVEFQNTEYRIIPGRFELDLFNGPFSNQISASEELTVGPTDRMPEVGDPQIINEELVQGRSFLRERQLSSETEAALEVGRGAAGQTGGTVQGEGGPAASGRVVERLVDGVVVERALDRDGDGTIDYWGKLEEGSLVRAIRDIDFDGFFEATELYSVGALREIVVDSDDDGRPDYRRLLGESPEKQWDPDQNGSFDVVAGTPPFEELRKQLAVAAGIDDIVRIWSAEQQQE